MDYSITRAPIRYRISRFRRSFGPLGDLITRAWRIATFRPVYD